MLNVVLFGVNILSVLEPLFAIICNCFGKKHDIVNLNSSDI